MKTSVERKNRGAHLGGLPGIIFNLDYGWLLPAPSAATAAVTAAIAAIPAATSAATATTTTRPPTAARSPASTSAVAAARTSTAASARTSAASAAAFTRGACFVDHNIAAHEIVAVQSLHGAVGFFIAIDLYKSEPARLS